jgi:hypothetical protein
MRLGQLARKLAVRPAAIVEFLAGNQIAIEEGSNTRIEDDYVRLVIERFDPSKSQEMFVESGGQEESETPVPEIESGNSGPAEIPVEQSQITVNEEKMGVIKAPKIELPGLKVLGKIEMPEPRKKEVASDESASPVESAVVPDEIRNPKQEIRKAPNQRNERRDTRPKRNPIAVQRERESEEAEKKRKEELERKKTLRTQHYFKKVRATAPTKSLKLIDEPVDEMTAEQTPSPKTGWGRFIKWLTT